MIWIIQQRVHCCIALTKNASENTYMYMYFKAIITLTEIMLFISDTGWFFL